MATRKTGKVQTKLVGGPYHGASVPMTPGCGSLSFKFKEFEGHYCSNGKWKSELVQIVYEDNPNFVLGYN